MNCEIYKVNVVAVEVENLDDCVKVIVDWENDKYKGSLRPVNKSIDEKEENFKIYNNNFKTEPQFKIDYDDGYISFVKLVD